MPLDSIRADKYLHLVRLVPTRPLAVAACEKSNVRIDGQPIKPARALRAGDILHIERGDLQLIIKVIAFPARRIGAALVSDFYENLTPTENYLRAAQIREQRQLTTPAPQEQQLRPTKKNLRAIRQWLGRD
jgi:ribosome-associated heat shock protein Hsp15